MCVEGGDGGKGKGDVEGKNGDVGVDVGEGVNKDRKRDPGAKRV